MFYALNIKNLKYEKEVPCRPYSDTSFINNRSHLMFIEDYVATI